MKQVQCINPETVTKFKYIATNNGDDEVAGDLDFSSFTALTECEMNYSKLDNLNWLSTFPNTIIKISCTSNDLYQMELPSTFPTYTNLTHCNLSNGGLKGTIPNIGHLTSLRVFKVEGNIWGGFEGASSWRGHLLSRHSIATTRFDLGTTGYTGLTAVASDFAIPDTLEQLTVNLNGLSPTQLNIILLACVNQNPVGGVYKLKVLKLTDQANGGNTLDSTGLGYKTTLTTRTNQGESGSNILDFKSGNKTTGDGVLI